MKFTSHLIDKKIMGVNIAAVMSIEEYFRFAPDILEKNAYQRRKVKSGGKTYDLLRDDLVQGCVIPPIILAVTSAYGPELNDLVVRAINEGDKFDEWQNVYGFVEKAAKDGELLILDGLQRTLTIAGVLIRDEGNFSPDEKDALMASLIRTEMLCRPIQTWYSIQDVDP